MVRFFMPSSMRKRRSLSALGTFSHSSTGAYTDVTLLECVEIHIFRLRRHFPVVKLILTLDILKTLYLRLNHIILDFLKEEFRLANS